MSQIDELKKTAAEIRDAQKELENTARKIGTMFLSVIDAYKAAAQAATTANDGYMTAEMAAMLKSHSSSIDAIIRFVPMPFDGIDSIDPKLVSDIPVDWADSDRLVFDKNSTTFLLRRKDLYYRSVNDKSYIGKTVTVGRLYVCGNRIFVGMPNGSLSEISESRINEIRDL